MDRLEVEISKSQEENGHRAQTRLFGIDFGIPVGIGVTDKNVEKEALRSRADRSAD
jgi:hypothetical protein